MSRRLQKKLPLAKYPDALKAALEARSLPKKPRLPKYANLPIEQFDWADTLERLKQIEQNRKVEFDKFQATNFRLPKQSKPKQSNPKQSKPKQTPKKSTRIFPGADHQYILTTDELNIDEVVIKRNFTEPHSFDGVILYPFIDMIPDSKLDHTLGDDWIDIIKESYIENINPNADFDDFDADREFNYKQVTTTWYSNYSLTINDFYEDIDDQYANIVRLKENYGYVIFGYSLDPIKMTKPKIYKEKIRKTKIFGIGPTTNNPCKIAFDASEEALDCIPNAVEDIINERKRRGQIGQHMDVVQSLGMENRNSGCSIERLLQMCELYKISYGICDITYTVIEHKLFNNKLRGLYGMVQLYEDRGHFYPIICNKTIRDVFNRDEDMMCNDKQLAVEIKCLDCKKVFINTCSLLNHTRNTGHMDKRDVFTIKNFKEALVKYINKYNRNPIINSLMTEFSDSKNIYRLPIDTIAIGHSLHASTVMQRGGAKKIQIRTKNYFNSYGEYGIKYIRDRLPSVESERGIGNSFLFDCHCTPFREVFYDVTNDYEYDISKCYTAIAASIELPVFDALAELRPYDIFTSNIKDGHFYHYQNKLYAAPLARELKYPYDAYIAPSKMVSLKPFIKHVYSMELTIQEKKDIVNKTIGLLGIAAGTSKGKCHIATDEELGYNMQLAKGRRQHLEVIRLEKNKNVIRRDQKYPMLNSSKPAHNYLIQTSRAIMLKLKRQGESQLALCLAVNTDAIYFDKEVKLDAEFLLDGKEGGGSDWGGDGYTTELRDNIFTKYKIGHIKPAKLCSKSFNKYSQTIALEPNNVLKIPKMVNKLSLADYRKDHPECSPSELVVNYSKKIAAEPTERIECSEWESIDKLSFGKSCLITGMPGCGKSYKWKHFKKQLIKKLGIDPKQIKEMSFQNNVASDISADAKTIHRTFMINTLTGKTSIQLSKSFKNVKYIYVDEAQMMPSEAIKMLSWIKTNMPQIIHIYSGDFKQWPSIKSPYTINNINILELCDYRKLHIAGNKRIADKAYVAALEKSPIDAINYINAITEKQDPKYYITYYSNECINNNYKYINSTIYKRLHPNWNNTRDDLWNFESKRQYGYHVELPVVANCSVKSKNIIKGKHYYIHNIKQAITDTKAVCNVSDVIELRVSKDFHSEVGKPIFVCVDDFYKFFELGYAFTSHKTIGLTIKAPYAVMTNVPKKVTSVYYYVSLSRCNDPKQITLLASLPQETAEFEKIEYDDNVFDMI